MQQHSANKILVQINVKYTYDIMIFKTALDLRYYTTTVSCSACPDRRLSVAMAFVHSRFLSLSFSFSGKPAEISGKIDAKTGSAAKKNYQAVPPR